MDAMRSKFEDKGREEEAAVTSMVQLEKVLNNGTEKVIKSMGSAPSEAAAASTKAKMNKSIAMPNMTME